MSAVALCTETGLVGFSKSTCAKECLPQEHEVPSGDGAQARNRAQARNGAHEHERQHETARDEMGKSFKMVQRASERGRKRNMKVQEGARYEKDARGCEKV